MVVVPQGLAALGQLASSVVLLQQSGAAKYILHKMGLDTCWLAIYADDERWAEVFHCIYIHNIKKEAMNEQLMAQLEAVYPI